MIIIMSRLGILAVLDDLESLGIQKQYSNRTPRPGINPPKVMTNKYMKKQSFHSLNGMACSISVIYSLMCASILRYSS